MSRHPTQRFGRLGRILDEVASLSLYPVSSFSELTLLEQCLTLTTTVGNDSTVLLRTALSLEHAKYPLQVSFDNSKLLLLVICALPVYGSECIGSLRREVESYLGADLVRHKEWANLRRVLGRSSVMRRTSPRCETLTSQFVRGAFPYKQDPRAKAKANIHADTLYDSMLATGKEVLAAEVTHHLLTFGGCLNDQYCSAILMAIALDASRIPGAALLAAELIMAPALAKELSGAIKALGATTTTLGGQLCESQVLQGRGIGAIDLRKAAVERCDPAFVADSVVDVDPTSLAATVRTILREEIGDREVSYDSLDEHWDRRWAWCVNGSHSNLLDRKLARARLSPYNRFYRRMYAEEVVYNPLSDWDGTTLVSASEKFEHGKTRAIFACDTRSYMAFEHLLRPVESAWRDLRVILDPGALGHGGVADRVRKARSAGGCSLMLDYDDFNSQHSTASMQVVIRELAAYVGYPPALSERLVGSFDQEWMHHKGEEVGHVVGTLMSGHRATTFLNSVLNAAYIRLGVGESLYKTVYTMHVGDDVFCQAPSTSEAVTIIEKMAAMGARLNPAKQSIGTVAGEFLRLAVDNDCSRGYYPRSVASLVSGSWVSDTALNSLERLESVVATTRSLINRGGTTEVARVLSRPVSRAVGFGRRVVEGLLSGSVSLNNGPVWWSTGAVRVARVSPPEYVEERLDQLAANATDAYLARHLSTVEALAFTQTGKTTRTAMISSSYSKAIERSPEERRPSRMTTYSQKLPGGHASASDLRGRSADTGHLTRYPLLNFLKNDLSPEMLRVLLGHLGIFCPVGSESVAAWGADSVPHLMRGVTSYSDASSLGRKTSSGVITFPKPVYM